MVPAVTVPFVSEPVGNTLLLVGSFVLLLVGAEIFTNGVEWLGHRLDISESATGSILAAVGTALPESMIAIIAIIQQATRGGTAGDEVGVGAILGAPFMLATIAMFLVGSCVLYFARRRQFGAEMHFNAVSTRRDLTFFLFGYSLAFLAAVIENWYVDHAIAVTLVVLYLVYLYRSLTSGQLIEEGGLDELHLGLVLDESLERLPGPYPTRRYRANPNTVLVVVQTLLALGIIIGGAHLFVDEVQWASREVLGIPPAIVALLLAPLATELPEKFNSVLWISRDKDTLALGNITGAMAFQGTLPVTLGIVFTSWDLSLVWGTTGFLNGFSAVLAIVSGGILYLRARAIEDGNMHPWPFLVGGLFYLLFIVIVVYHVLAFDLSGVAH